MTGKNKTRVVLSIDEDVWKEFKENIKKGGYPRGTASWFVQQKLESINLQLEVVGESPELDMLSAVKLK